MQTRDAGIIRVLLERHGTGWCLPQGDLPECEIANQVHAQGAVIQAVPCADSVAIRLCRDCFSVKAQGRQSVGNGGAAYRETDRMRQSCPT